MDLKFYPFKKPTQESKIVLPQQNNIYVLPKKNKEGN